MATERQWSRAIGKTSESGLLTSAEAGDKIFLCSKRDNRDSKELYGWSVKRAQEMLLEQVQWHDRACSHMPPVRAG